MELSAESVEVCVCRMRDNSTSRISKRGIHKGEVLQRCHREPLNDYPRRGRQLVSNNTSIDQIGVQDTPQTGWCVLHADGDYVRSLRNKKRSFDDVRQFTSAWGICISLRRCSRSKTISFR